MKQKVTRVLLGCVLSFAIVAAGAAVIYGYLEVWNLGHLMWRKSDLTYGDAIYHSAQACYFAGLIGGATLGLAVPIYVRMCRRTRQKPAELGAPPNGGPATRLGNSGATEGPPSVS
jgi:hypothetical protein